MVFEEGIEIDLADDFIYFKKSKEIPTSSFDNYHYRGPKLALYSFYDYQKIITVVISTLVLEEDIVFPMATQIEKKKFNNL